MKDDIRNLYDALVKNGYSIDDLGGSEDNFRANMRDEKIRGEFYDWVVGRDDFNIGSRDAYERRMTGALGSLTANAAPQQDNAQTINIPEMESPEAKPLPGRELSFNEQLEAVRKNAPSVAFGMGDKKLPFTYESPADKNAKESLGRMKMRVDAEKYIADMTGMPRSEINVEDYVDGGRYAQRLRDIEEIVEKMGVSNFSEAKEKFVSATGVVPGAGGGDEVEQLKSYLTVKRTPAGERVLDLESGSEAVSYKPREKELSKLLPKEDMAQRGYGGYSVREIETGRAPMFAESLYNRDKADRAADELLMNAGNDVATMIGDIRARWLADDEVIAYNLGGQELITTYDRKTGEPLDNRSIIEKGIAGLNSLIAGVGPEDWSTSPEDQMILTARDLLAEAAQMREAATGDKGLVGGISDAIGDWNPVKALDVITDAVYLKKLNNKIKNGEHLKMAEQILLDALKANIAVRDSYGKRVSGSYEVGKIVGDMIPYAVEMMLNPLSGTGKAAGKAAVKKMSKEFAESLGGKAVKRTAELLGSTLGGGAMALTSGLPKTIGGTISRMTGTPVSSDNEYGVDFVGAEDSYSTAFFKEWGANTLGYASEQFGASMASALTKPVTKYIGKAASKVVSKIPGGTRLLNGITHLVDETEMGKVLSDFMARGNYHGVTEEFFEEVYNALANAATVGDTDLDEFFSTDNIVKTAAAVAIPGVAVHIVNGGANAVEIHNRRKAAKARIERAESVGVGIYGKNWWDSAVRKNLTSDDLETVKKEMTNILNSDLSGEQKNAMIVYAVSNMEMRTLDGLQKLVSSSASGEAAYAAYQDMMNAEAEALKRLKNTEHMDVGNLDEWLNGINLAAVPWNSEESYRAVREYVYAKRAFDNSRDAFKVAQQEMYDQSDEAIDSNSNNNMVYSTIHNGEEVFITGGNVVLNEDGTIDVNNSSESLYIKFPDGHKEPISANKLAGKITVQNAEELKTAGKEAIDAKMKAEFDTAEAQAIEQEKRAKGVVFDMTDPEGTHRVEIINEGDDMSDILLDGAPVKMFTDELNQWKQEAGIQTESAVADDATDNGTPTESEANVAPVELPNVPDFFRLGGKNYSVVSRNDDGSVDVMVDGKRETLPAGTDYSTHMPTDKKGEVQYEQMPVERTHEYFVQRVKDDEARAEMIEKRRKKAEAERKKFDKKPDPGIDPDAYDAKMTQWEAGKKAAQAKVDYWNEVAKRETEITRSEMREAVEGIQPRDVVEQTAEEFIADHMPKITPESFKKETGLSNSEQSEMVGYIANKDKGGVTIEQAAEGIVENYGDELRSLGYAGDMQDVRNLIIDILSNGNPRGYAKRGYEARVQDDIDQQRADAEAWAKGAFDMKLEELYLYEETILPRIIRDYEGFDENEYYSNLAENNGYDTTRESESIGRGSELLQGEQPVPAGGTPVVGQRNEGGAVSDDVQGGGQNGVAQEEVPVNEPVGNSEQLSSSEIPNNQSVAEGDAPGQSSVYSLSELTDNEGNRFYQKNGSIDLWDLSPLFVQARRQNAPIRLTERNIDHILDEHKKELGDSEESVLKFLDDVFSTAKVLRKARSGGIFVVVENTKTDKAAIIRLYPSKYGDYYNVESAGYYRKNKWKDTENVIAELSEPTQSVTASDVSKPQVPEEGGKELLNAETATTSASEDRNSVSNSQENTQKSGEIAENVGERMYSQEELAETKEQLGELNATSAPNFAVRLFSIRPWGTLEEANAALKELLASYGETLNGQTTAVLPFLDEAQRLISENSKNQEPRSVEENLDNGDKRITSYNSRGEVATVAIERDGKVVSVDTYDEGVLFEHTEYDTNGKAASVTRYDKQGNVVGTQVYEDGKAKTPMQKLADRKLDRTEEKRRIPLRERARELEAQVGVKANIIESLDEVKNSEARKRIAAGEAVAGWYSGGQVYLYMPNIKDRREIELTYVHEVVAHHGVKKLLGERFNEFLDGVWNMMSEADRARMLAYVGANETPTLQDMRAAADEYVAELAEKMNLNELEQSTWDKIVDWFKELLENIGFENLTKEDIESMLKASYSNLRAESGKGKTGSTENDFRARMTFHGSGAKFDRFDHAFMGTGEGAQVFGWGTYVTEVEGIGRTYATMMRDKAISDKHRENAIINNHARQVLASNNGDKNAALEELRNLLNESWSDKKRVKAEIKIIETGKFLPESKVKANLYTVEIPDDNGSNYLHWEERINGEIQERVANGLQNIGFEIEPGMNHLAYSRDGKIAVLNINAKGKDLYAELSEVLGGDKEASQFLNEMGFVGISYPANATTGGRTDGARNYVIFNENDAEIKDSTMFRKRDSERRQEKRRINNIIDTAAGFVTVGGKKQATKNRLKKEAERKQLAKEMYSSVLKGDFNNVTLSQIDKFIEDATPANPFGRRISQRLPQRMERALRAYERTNAVDALFSRISESAVPANERFSEAGRREIEERKKELLKGWAIATGNWHTDLKEFTDDTEPIGEGLDSKVYSAKEGPFVIKASKGKPYGKRFRPDIDNIALFNDVFRNSRYEILGYGEIDGDFVRILKQRAVDFSNSTPLAVEERVEYMRSLGFEPINKDNTAFSNGEIVIADLQKSNIVRDVEGDIRVIDADAKLHTKDVGGDYTYPPVEDDLPEDSGTRFRIANENQDIFVSNAQRAVEGIQQNKATAEQWIAMLKKNGGLKAGEDAWLGLEEWLAEKGKVKGESGKVEPVTKQEILDFIGENKIQIEEVHYGESVEGISEETVSESEEFGNLASSLIEYDEEDYPYVDRERFEQLRNEDEDFLDGFSIDYWGEGIEVNDPEAAARYLGLTEGSRPINSTRLEYTTDGLENKREIVLVVPTVESWNASDEIHFGDAGEGRAVAWVRFGETTVYETVEDVQEVTELHEPYRGVNGHDIYKPVGSFRSGDYIVHGKAKTGEMIYVVYINDKQIPIAHATLEEARNAMNEYYREHPRKLRKPVRVLVIDEIQSKRHQEGREKGYEKTDANDAFETYRDKMMEKYNLPSDQIYKILANEEKEEFDRLRTAANEEFRTSSDVPSAPFEKNWHELAMKRMLRLAAEEGFDKVAWTTGEQQAERYNLRKQVGSIEVRRDNGEYNVFTYNIHGSLIYEATATMTPEQITETFGKELGGKILAVESGKRETITGVDLNFGGEGMKGFYDRMLPSFVSKYTKKWGAKVGEVTMPNLSENNTMHSVDVTPEMKESVMEGQTMFRRGERNKAKLPTSEQQRAKQAVLELIQPFAKEKREEQTKTMFRFIDELVEEFNKSHKGGARVVNIDPSNMEAELAEEGFGAEDIQYFKERVEKGAQAFYDSERDLIYLFDPTVSKEDLKPILWHEDTHKAISDLDIDQDLLNEFYALINKDRKKSFETIAERGGYEKEEYPEECVACCIQGLSTLDKWNARALARITKATVEDADRQFEIIQPLIDYIKYGRETGENVRRESLDRADVASKMYDAESAKFEKEAEEGAGAAETAAGFGQEGETRFRTVEDEKLSPEEKERQRKLKDNAKAIRRLHNVKSNYPITALRNLGFALETQEQREEHDRLFAERDAISGRQNAVSAEVNPQSMTLMERITESLMKAAVQNKENVDMRMSAIRAYGRDLSNVLKLMRAQRGYDRNTVRMFTNLVKMYLRNNSMSGMSSYDITRLLGLIERANGGYGPQVMRAAEQIAEIITKSHIGELENIVRKQIKTGAEKVNASGVVVQGGVDIIGKRVLNTFRDAINMTTEEEFEKAYKEAFERAAKFPNDEEAKAACDAMVIAKEYRDNIAEAKQQEKELLKSIGKYSDIRSRYDKGEVTRKEYNEYVDSVRRSLIELHSSMIDDYQRVIHALGGDISEGIKRAKEFREREIERMDKIHRMAEADMGDISKSAERKKRGFLGKTTDYIAFKNPIVKIVTSGLGTYNEYMKFFGRNAIGGKGRLYDYFMRRYTEVQNQEWIEKQKDIKKIDDECKKIFGEGYEAVMHDSARNSGVVLEYWNGGEMVTRELSVGQLMYIYMAAKQTDGEMKLRGMGITEEAVNNAVQKLPATYKAFADWVQSDFLPEMRPRMNEVHKRMFGASMSEVKNYFPLVVNKDARQGEVDLNSVMPINPSTITGSIIKRKVNATPLNLESNAFDVLLNHVSDMEHWAAFAEFTRDNNTLIGDKDFMNRIKNTRDLRYGTGEAIWDDFVETARITTGNYRAKNDELTNFMKGVSSAKITFGYYTALKQFLSAPGMWGDAALVSIVKATVNPMGSWKWAKENLPGFAERWEGRTAGNERLADSDNDWSVWDNRVVKAARELGMTPNAFVDAVVVATGARAVYDSRKRFYKAIGLTEAEQHKRAQADAAAAYNETQQSVQGAYLSVLQKEGGFKAMVLTLYRNSQMAYTRKVTGSMAELLKKASRWNDVLKNTEEKYIEMGLSKEDAHKVANKEFLKSGGKDIVTLVMFGYILKMVWYLGEQLPYLLFGDDDEEKKEIFKTALKVGASGMFEGFSLGNIANDLYVKGVTGNKYSTDMLTTPFISDLEKTITRFANDGTLAGMSQLLILGVETMTGISPQRLIDDAAALIDFADGNLDKATEAQILAMRLLKVPQSQVDKIYLEKAIGGDVLEIADRYAEYKRLRDYPLNTLIGGGNKEIKEKYIRRFNKAYNEDLLEIAKDENSYSGYYENASPEEKIKLADMRKKYLEDLTGEEAQEEELTTEELVYSLVWGKKKQNLVYSRLTTSDDVDDDIAIKLELKKHEDIYNKGKDLMGEEWQNFKKANGKEYYLYEDLKSIERKISNEKTYMEKNPEKADKSMEYIRKKRAEAIKLINEYYNE